MRYIAIGCLLALLAGCSTPLETVSIPSENKGWKVGYRSDRQGATMVEFIPEDETINAWSRMLTIQFIEGETRSPKALMKALESVRRAKCPNTTWEVIGEDSTSVTYEWTISGCSDGPDQHEVARLLKGNDGVHRIAYVRKTPKFYPMERDLWLKAFAGAHVVKDGNRVVVAP